MKMSDFDDGKGNQRRVKMKLDHPQFDELHLSGHLLKSIVQFLDPRDVLSCIQTCQQWRNEIDEEVWIAVAKNISPMAVSAIEASVEGRSTRLDYRSIALGLACPNEQPEPELSFPRPSLRLEDVLAVLEIRDLETKEPLGAWSGAFTEFPQFLIRGGNRSAIDLYGFMLNGNSLTLAGFRDMFASMATVTNDMERYPAFNPAVHTPSGVYGGMEMRMSLIRLDAGNTMYGKTVCLNNFTKIRTLSLFGSAYFTCSHLTPCASNGAGTVARELCFHRRYNYMSAVLEVVMKPAFEHSNQNEWARRVAEEGDHRSTRMDELKKNLDEQFKYSFSCIRFNLAVCIGEDELPNDSFQCKDDLLLVLEGLNWQ